MNWKTIVACGMLLGLLTTVSLAQHQIRGSGSGTMPGARLPNAVPNGGPVNSGIGLGSSSQTIRPNATSSPTAKTVSPNASTGSSHAGTVGPNTETLPSRTTLPDANGLGNHTTDVGPTQR
jgi:hypothetical protein